MLTIDIVDEYGENSVVNRLLNVTERCYFCAFTNVWQFDDWYGEEPACMSTAQKDRPGNVKEALSSCLGLFWKDGRQQAILAGMHITHLSHVNVTSQELLVLAGVSKSKEVEVCVKLLQSTEILSISNSWTDMDCRQKSSPSALPGSVILTCGVEYR